MNRFITNADHISTSTLYDLNYLSHGVRWGKHRYVRREGSVGNWRYIYPEDLKKAGQNLITGAKNLASNAGDAVSNTARNAHRRFEKVTGIAQRKSLQRATEETRKWVDRYNGIKPSQYAIKNADYASRNVALAYLNQQQAREAYEKTPLGIGERAFNQYLKNVKDNLGYISFHVNSFLMSTESLFKKPLSAKYSEVAHVTKNNTGSSSKKPHARSENIVPGSVIAKINKDIRLRTPSDNRQGWVARRK